MRSEYNNTLLHDAAYDNSTSCMRVLLRFAPHLLDAGDVDNHTPLVCAARNDSRDVVKMLLRAGADVRKEDHNGSTVFYWASQYEIDVGNTGTTSTGKWNILILLKL